jgi:hypothetical protein
VLARAPSEFLTSVLAIDVPCLCLEPRAQFQHGREAHSFAGMPLRLGISPRTAFQSGRQLSIMRRAKSEPVADLPVGTRGGPRQCPSSPWRRHGRPSSA